MLNVYMPAASGTSDRPVNLACQLVNSDRALFAQQLGKVTFRHYHDMIFERFWDRNLVIEDIEGIAAVLPIGLVRVVAIGRAAEAGGVVRVPAFIIDGEMF